MVLRARASAKERVNHMNRMFAMLVALVWGVSSVAAQKEDVATELARKAIQSLAEANMARDFTGFHGLLAPKFRDRADPDKLLDLFGWLADPEWGLDWTAIDGETELAIANVESIGETGGIRINGSVMLGVSRLMFEMEFVAIREKWLLASIFVRPAYEE